jgi:hypothetical protein
MVERGGQDEAIGFLTGAGFEAEKKKQELAARIVQAEQNTPEGLGYLLEFGRQQYGVSECFTPKGLIVYDHSFVALEEYAADIASLGAALAAADAKRAAVAANPAPDSMPMRTHTEQLRQCQIRPALTMVLNDRFSGLLRRTNDFVDHMTGRRRKSH